MTVLAGRRCAKVDYWQINAGKSEKQSKAGANDEPRQ